MAGRLTLSMRSWVGAGFAIGALFAETSARANPMDLAPERLTYCDPTSAVPCGGAKPNAGGTGFDTNYYRADNVAWAKLMSQYAMAIAPTAMHPARTTGYGGFQLSLFGTFTTISKDESFIHKGTEGAITDGKKFPSANNSPDGMLQVYGVTGRKGLPYGFELQGSVGYIANTELVTVGGGIRIAPFEGWRNWFDLSVGGYVNTLTGTNKVKMTVPALDVQASRPFVIANQVILQPYVGWQIIWINVDSGVVDATPAYDGLGKCNARPSSPTERNTDKTANPNGGDTGEFKCQERANNGQGQITGDAAAGSATATNKLDLNNNVVFRNMRAWTRNRLFFGLSGRWEHLHWTIPHVALELTDPAAGEPEPDKCPAGVTSNNTNSCGKKRIEGLAKQVTFGATVGLEW